MAELKIKADSGGGTVSFKGPATTTSNAAVQLTLPVDDGTANQYLKTDGSGALSWATVSSTPEGEAILSTTNSNESDQKFLRADGDGTSTWQNIEGTVLRSTGETGTSKFLRIDGDNTCSWQGLSGILKWDYAVCEGAKTTTTNGSPGDKTKGVELFTKDFACISSTSTVIIMTNPISFYETSNGNDNFWLSAWQGTTQISAVSGTPRYEVWQNALNAGCLGYFGRHQPGGTSSITYSIRGGGNTGSETTNIQNSNSQQSDQNTRSHMFLFEVEAN